MLLKLDFWEVLLQLFRIKDKNISFLVVLIVDVTGLFSANHFRHLYVCPWCLILRIRLSVVAMLGPSLLLALYVLFEQALELFSLRELLSSLVLGAHVDVLCKLRPDSVKVHIIEHPAAWVSLAGRHVGRLFVVGLVVLEHELVRLSEVVIWVEVTLRVLLFDFFNVV